MIHQPKVSITGEPLTRAEDAYMDLDEVKILRRTVLYNYANRSPMPLEVIAADMERDTFMSPTEAQAYGIIDSIGVDW